MRKIKDQILKLHTEGLNYDQIAKELNCSKGAISYHLGKGQKEKYANRRRKRRSIVHPLIIKIESFLYRNNKIPKGRKPYNTIEKLIYLKVYQYNNRKTKMNSKPNFTVEQVLEKIGSSPKCYLTGRTIDINKPRTYSLDHRLPSARGGDNSLDNLELASKEANSAKTDLTVEEFVQLCKDVLTNFGYDVRK